MSTGRQQSLSASRFYRAMHYIVLMYSANCKARSHVVRLCDGGIFTIAQLSCRSMLASCYCYSLLFLCDFVTKLIFVTCQVNLRVG